MKKLLVLSWFFPPHGGGGVLRPADTVRFLAGQGWSATVIAGPESGWWVRDPELERRVPTGTLVLRAGGLTGPGLLRKLPGRDGREGPASRSERRVRFFRRLTDWLPLPDVYCGWIPAALRAAAPHLSSTDWILSTSPPESAHLAAWELARRSGRPWVADFRDPWLNGIYRRCPTPAHRAFQARLERLVVERAELVLATSREAAADFRARYPQLPPEKFHCLPNGFDPEEFPPCDPTAGLPLRIIHAGGLTLDRELGPLLEALRKLGPSREKIRLELCGLAPEGLAERVARLGLAEVVTISGYLPRRELLERLARAHLGLVLESFSPRAALVVPGKLYDYLGAGLPVLALVPPGAAAEVVRRTGAGVALTAPDPEALHTLLSGALARLERGEPPLALAPQPEEIAHYRRPRLVAELAALLERRQPD